MATYYQIQFVGVQNRRPIIADNYEIVGPVTFIDETGLTIHKTDYARAIFKLEGKVVAELNMNNVCGIFIGDTI